MAKIEFRGLDEYVKQLNRIESNTERYIGKALFDGAKVVADTVKASIVALPTDNRAYKEDIMRTGPSTIQKKGLIDGFGVARARMDGTLWNVKLGFDGYNGVKSKKWPKGQPNSMIARSVESGTSFMRANRFMAKAVSSAKAQCEATMKRTLENEISKLVK